MVSIEKIMVAGQSAVWIDAAFALAGKKLVRVSHKFRIGSGAQLVQVHALALSFDRDAEGIEPVE
jgi:hypothetical protein